jgi:hypothetical protein
MKRVLFFVAISLFIPAIVFAQEREVQRIDSVVRVFMHTPGDYSVMVENKIGFEMVRINSWLGELNCDKNEWTFNKWDFSVFLAKSTNGKMSVVTTEDHAKRRVVTRIFITGPDDVGGASWYVRNNRNQSREVGMTTVVR